MTFTDEDIGNGVPLNTQVWEWATSVFNLDAVTRGLEIERFAAELKKQGISAPKKILNAALSETRLGKSDGGRPFRKLGRSRQSSVRYHVDDIDSFIARSKRCSTCDPGRSTCGCEASCQP